MRRSDLEKIADAVDDRICNNMADGHPDLTAYKSADEWENRDQRTKDRICNMIDFTVKLVPYLLDDDLNWFLIADEGITTAKIEVDDILPLSRNEREQIATLILTNAKTHCALDCVRGRSIRFWLNRRNWEKIMRKWPPMPR